MTEEASSILRQALNLGDAARAEIADALIRSLEPPSEAAVEEAWREEVRRRLADYKSGDVATVPWSEVRDRMYSRLRAPRG